MVKTLFDTSVLVAAFWVDHPKHIICINWLQKAKNKQIQGLIATHSLAEIYSVLTRLPVKNRISPRLAQRLISENTQEFEVINLMNTDYQDVIFQMVNLNLTGGAIYDALIAQAAAKFQAEKLLTLNPDHFTRLGEPISQIVEVPV